MDYFDELEDDVDSLSGESEGSFDEESSYVCDSCGEEIVVPIDFSEGRSQEYVEDCPVCCNPNLINVEFDIDGGVRIWGRADLGD